MAVFNAVACNIMIQLNGLGYGFLSFSHLFHVLKVAYFEMSTSNAKHREKYNLTYVLSLSPMVCIQCMCVILMTLSWYFARLFLVSVLDPFQA